MITTATHHGTCSQCQHAIYPGERIVSTPTGLTRHVNCGAPPLLNAPSANSFHHQILASQTQGQAKPRLIDIYPGNPSAISILCPYCRDCIVMVDPFVFECSRCKTKHHDECFKARENKCAVFGCDGRKVAHTDTNLETKPSPSTAGQSTNSRTPTNPETTFQNAPRPNGYSRWYTGPWPKVTESAQFVCFIGYFAVALHIANFLVSVLVCIFGYQLCKKHGIIKDPSIYHPVLLLQALAFLGWLLFSIFRNRT